MRDYNIFHSIEYVIHGSKIHIQSGYILLTLELCVKRLRRFGRPKRRNRFKVSSKSEWNLTTFNMLHDLKDVWFRRWANAGITVAHRLRRWANIIPALAVGHVVTKMCWHLGTFMANLPIQYLSYYVRRERPPEAFMNNQQILSQSHKELYCLQVPQEATCWLHHSDLIKNEYLTQQNFKLLWR